MEEYELYVNVISAEDLKDVRHLERMQTYAVVRIDSGGQLDASPEFETRVDEVGGCNPVWNEEFFLTFSQKSSKSLIIEILSEGLLGSKPVGKVEIPLDGLKEGGDFKYINKKVTLPNGDHQGKLYLSYNMQKKPTPKASSEHLPRSILKSSVSKPSPSLLKKRVSFKDVMISEPAYDAKDYSVTSPSPVGNVAIADKSMPAVTEEHEVLDLGKLTGLEDNAIVDANRWVEPPLVHGLDVAPMRLDGLLHTPKPAEVECWSFDEDYQHLQGESISLLSEPLRYPFGSLFKGNLGRILLS
ncbi:hypothetical protein KP509_20G032300 [Ceratopteris richardii]|uniref:C2 domain-containing protein n=1 Tax=Ceratopteris richardii TaxID=49495 RepID=A0A8T2SE93_CERRI|nr:hypothetical protein KP509_20G032300 [Ceratopteris richardii]KAH7331426.1 hypothetical protein KP509_20G032300 [Ceratopteris richardii]